MHKLDVAFCDTNETYGERFAAYLMEHKAKEFTVHLFPEPELFLQKIKNEKYIGRESGVPSAFLLSPTVRE